MGLDQCAYTRDANTAPDEAEPTFIWRKHAKLQEWAERLFVAKTGRSSVDLNCGELHLDRGDVVALQELIEKEALPESSGGFFFGHQFQDEAARENHDQDLEFCDWALKAINDGQDVYYSCWW